MTKYATYSEYLAHPLFRASVTCARERANGKCEGCGRECATEPHHLRYCRWGEFDPPENLKMLCRACHENAHRCSKCGRVTLKAWHIKRGITACCEPAGRTATTR